MAENSALAPPSKKKRVSIPPAVLVAGGMAVVGLAGFWYLDRPAPPKEPAPLTGAAKAYVRGLKLANVDMQAHESYLKQSIVEITGDLGNTGDRVLKSVEINCVFYDPYGQVVLRERVAIVNRKTGALAPGETKPFRMAFDNVPEDWNQAMPQMVIAAIDFS
ncbi:MAG: FxLYD domain-containing protein [Bryobacteraceae bacterium]